MGYNMDYMVVGYGSVWTVLKSEMTWYNVNCTDVKILTSGPRDRTYDVPTRHTSGVDALIN